MIARRHSLFRPGIACALLAVFTAMAGCSAVRLAYENVDWFLIREADGLLDLDSAQRAVLEATLGRRIERHRARELPAHLALLRDARDMIADGLTAQEVATLFGEIRTQALDVVRETVPALTPTLSALDRPQIEHLAERLRERNDEFREKFIQDDRAERYASRFGRLIERIEHWTGSLTDSQRESARALHAGFPDSTANWLSYREGKHLELLRRLRAGTTPAELDDYLLGWLVRLEGRNFALETQGDALWSRAQSLILALDRMLTPAQRARVLDRIDGYVEDFAPLAVAGG